MDSTIRNEAFILMSLQNSLDSFNSEWLHVSLIIFAAIIVKTCQRKCTCCYLRCTSRTFGTAVLRNGSVKQPFSWEPSSIMHKYIKRLFWYEDGSPCVILPPPQEGKRLWLRHNTYLAKFICAAITSWPLRGSAQLAAGFFFLFFFFPLLSST